MLQAQYFLGAGPTHIGWPHATPFTQEKGMKTLFKAQHHPMYQGSDIKNTHHILRRLF